MNVQLSSFRARATAVGVLVAALGAGGAAHTLGGAVPAALPAAESGAESTTTPDQRVHGHLPSRPAATAEAERVVVQTATRQSVTPPAARGRQDDAVRAAAERFLAEVAGMVGTVAGPVERSGDTAEATFFARGEAGQVVPALVTVVDLRRSDGVWVPVGARTPTIEVDGPGAGATIGSPLWVSGRAHAYEGTVDVRVVEVVQGSAAELGRGFVTGGGDAMRAFEGEIPFSPPSGTAGWVVFSESSAVDGSTSRATVVGVELAQDDSHCELPPAPVLEGPSWNPEVVLEDGWLRLPAGAGTLTVTVRATDADEVDLVLTPTGTETAPYAEVVDTSTGTDGVFTLRLEYADEPLTGHLSLVARGPGGETAVDLAGVYHAEPEGEQQPVA